MNKNCIAIILVCIVGTVFSVLSFIFNTPALAEELIAAQMQGEEGRLIIPLPDGVTFDDVSAKYDFESVSISIPGDDKDFYYNNSLKGDASNIGQLRYGYINDNYIFDIAFNELSECSVFEESGDLVLEIEAISEKYDDVIVINPAHGGEDTGTVSYSVIESYVNYNIAETLKDKLDSDRVGVFLTRTVDENPTEEERRELANKLGAKLYINIACKADEHTRVTSGMEFATNIAKLRNAFLSLDMNETQMINSGASMPELDVFAGYLTNKMDATMLTDDEKIDEKCREIADVILNY